MTLTSTFKHFQKKYPLSSISEELSDLMLSRKCFSPVWLCLASGHRCEESCEGLAQCAEGLAQSPDEDDDNEDEDDDDNDNDDDDEKNCSHNVQRSLHSDL